MAEFKVSGFGEKSWLIYDSLELCIFMEQLPFALRCAKEGSPFSIDFYEQSLQRRLDFEAVGKTLVVACYSGTDWEPNPRRETLELDYVVGMFAGFLETFRRLAEAIYPEIAAHPWYQKWLKGHHAV